MTNLQSCGARNISGVVQFIPSNLDLKQLVIESPPSFSYKLDHFVRLISLMYEHQLNQGNKRDELGWVQLSMQWLQKNVSVNSAKLIQYLHQNEIIEIDKSYVPGLKSRSYRLSFRHLVRPKPTKISDFSLLKKIRKRQSQFESSSRSLHYLLKWFDKKLEIDMAAVENYLNETYLQSFALIDEEQRRKYLNCYVLRYVAAYKISIGDWYFIRDEFAGRIHTNLTNLPSDLRRFITYNGEKIVSCDIPNSQPFLLSGLQKLEMKSGYVSLIDEKGVKHSICCLPEHFEDETTKFFL